LVRVSFLIASGAKIREESLLEFRAFPELQSPLKQRALQFVRRALKTREMGK
jgi:hypothetical protein